MEPGTSPVTARHSLAIDFSLPDDPLDLKLQAFETHVSQLEGMLNAFGNDFFREGYKAEFFVLADER